MRMLLARKMNLKGLLLGLLVLFVSCIVSFSAFENVNAFTGTKRSIAISYMQSMANQLWIADGAIHMSTNSTAGTYADYYGSTLYHGVPYTWDTNDTLNGFLTKKNTAGTPMVTYRTGSVPPYFKDPQPTITVGNDCSTAVALAWNAAGSSINATTIGTDEMLAEINRTSTGVIAMVGSYSISGDSESKTTANNPTKQTIMFAAYAQLKPGDACIYRWSKGGHAILVTGVTSTSITYIDQIGVGSEGSAGAYGWRLSSTHSTWTPAGQMTFTELYANHYIPLTVFDIALY